MESRVSTLKAPVVGVDRDAGDTVRPSADLSGTGVIHFGGAPRPSHSRIDISRELEALHSELSRLSFDDALRAKIEDSFMEARVACCLTQPDRTAVGEALNRALKTARRAEEFEGMVPSLRPHIERSVAWLGREWARILAVV